LATPGLEELPKIASLDELGTPLVNRRQAVLDPLTDGIAVDVPPARNLLDRVSPVDLGEAVIREASHLTPFGPEARSLSLEPAESPLLGS
jgi:hypothetical protein